MKSDYFIAKSFYSSKLLVCSYYFYMCWNPSYIVLILFSTIVTYVCSLVLEKIKSFDFDESKAIRLKKLCISCNLALNLGLLFFFKYFEFFLSNANIVLGKFHIQVNHPTFDILLPVGISFYTFQAIGYTIDVYRDDIYAERNFLKYALFVSYFPQLVAGPIERSKNLLKQLSIPVKLQFDNLKEGLLLMLWGYFLKIVLSDRVAIFVDTIYGVNCTNYSGYYFVVATFLFAIQIYCDFSGYTVIAMGASKMLGIDLMMNFDTPYFSKSTSEFWRRWHISLSSWFKDYLYIPLGGNRKGRGRKYLNLIVTFTISGLWHGAQWTYIAWGLLNGIYQVIGDILKPIKNIFVRILCLNVNSLGHKFVKVLTTFILISFSWIFFRAYCFKDALEIIKSIFTVHNPWILFDGSLYECGLDQKNFNLMIICIVIVFAADALKYKKIIVRDIIAKQDYWCQAVIISFSILSLLLFGIWGGSYNTTNFIYFQF